MVIDLHWTVPDTDGLSSEKLYFCWLWPILLDFPFNINFIYSLGRGYLKLNGNSSKFLRNVPFCVPNLVRIWSCYGAKEKQVFEKLN